MIAEPEPSFTSFQAVNSSAPVVEEIEDDEVEMPDFPDDAEVDPIEQSSAADEEEDVAEDEPDDAPEAVAMAAVVALPQEELSDDDVLDFTTGDDVVRRVMKELRPRDGRVMYRVEFEDRHVEEVRCVSGSPFTWSFCCFQKR